MDDVNNETASLVGTITGSDTISANLSSHGNITGSIGGSENIDAVINDSAASLTGTISGTDTVSATITPQERLRGSIRASDFVFENDYDLLENKPMIEEHILNGNSTLDDIGAHNISTIELLNILV